MMSLPINKYLLFIFSLFTAGFFFAQNSVSGRISDAKTSLALTGVDIYINNRTTPILRTTSADFKIEADTVIVKVKFSKKNYSLYEISITGEDNNNLAIALSPEKESNIAEVVIQKSKPKYKSKKENPAYAIMQEVWKRKKNNGLDKYDSYSYKEYEKIEFDANNIDSTFMNQKIFNKLDFIFDYADSTANGKMALPIFLNESIYENYGLNKPAKKNKRLLTAQKTSGFQDNQVVTITAKIFIVKSIFTIIL